MYMFARFEQTSKLKARSEPANSRRTSCRITAPPDKWQLASWLHTMACRRRCTNGRFLLFLSLPWPPLPPPPPPPPHQQFQSDRPNVFRSANRLALDRLNSYHARHTLTHTHTKLTKQPPTTTLTTCKRHEIKREQVPSCAISGSPSTT